MLPRSAYMMPLIMAAGALIRVAYYYSAAEAIRRLYVCLTLITYP
jgi:hypothetical protein